MQTVTIGTKNQIVIPKTIRKKIKAIKPGAKLNLYISQKNAVVMEPVELDWADRYYGIMKGAWKDKDPIAELEKMRDEWDDKLKEYEKTLHKR